jgi:hypothetical protein
MSGADQTTLVHLFPWFLSSSINPRHQPPRPFAVGIVLGAEVLAQQTLLGSDPPHQGHQQRSHQQDSNTGAKRQHPPQRCNEQPQVTRVADHAINPVRSELMPQLDRHQPAEAISQHRHRNNAQQSAQKDTTTPTQRIASPSSVQNPMRSVYDEKKAINSAITPNAPSTQRLPWSSLSPELMPPPENTASSTQEVDFRNHFG